MRSGRTSSMAEPPVTARRPALVTYPAQASEVPVLAVRSGAVERRPDRVVGEEPLQVLAAGPSQDPVDVAVTMRTPGDDEELAAGFLLTEGLATRADLAAATFRPGDPTRMAQPDNELLVRLPRPFDATAVRERHFVATASCGICGRASLDELVLRCEALPAGPRVPADVLLALPERMRAAQSVFEHTGGLHAAALFTAEGELVALREDVGRHNAVDKLVGSQVRGGRADLGSLVMLVSGRVSFEIAQKAAVAGVPVLCAISAPSDLACTTAARLGMTLVGFLRPGGFNVYAGEERIELGR
jgi:FdhD protein